jgi:transcription-repair coupling factor (superfamily II helicase)
VQRLVAVVEIKILARRLALERVELRRGELCLTFHPHTAVTPEHVLHWLQASGTPFRFPSEQVVCVEVSAAAPEERLARLKKLLQQLLAGASM